MSKRRKYDVKNKRSFIIILILAIAVIGIFSLFIYKYSKASKIQYVIESGSILQDVKKNYIIIDDDAILKIRWDGNYYLVYRKKTEIFKCYDEKSARFYYEFLEASRRRRAN